MFFEKIGYPAVYEQLAEECAELAKASLKMARISRGENPTSATYPEVIDNLAEEATDVYLCLFDLGLMPNPNTMYSKLKRFRERIEEMEPLNFEDLHEENFYSLQSYSESAQMKGDPGLMGPKGDSGLAGHTPVKGEDYWTEEDKTEIKNYINDQIAEMPIAQTWVKD